MASVSLSQTDSIGTTGSTSTSTVLVVVAVADGYDGGIARRVRCASSKNSKLWLALLGVILE